MNLPSLSSRLRMALSEDGAFRDVTSLQIPGIRRIKAQGVLLAKEKGLFCGGFLLEPIFKLLDPKAQIQILKKDGSLVHPGQILAKISGRAYALLTGERTYLNLACHLSGIATVTNKFVQLVKGTHTDILDTRKTMPLWRDLEKWAVACGGGTNHRWNLEDAVLVKDNHLSFLRKVKGNPEVVFESGRIRKSHRRLKFIEMEAKSMAEVKQALAAQADIVLLDNMSLSLLNKAIKAINVARREQRRATPLIEISGGVSLSNVRRLAKLGVDRISVGALTHSAPSLDLSLEVN